MNILPKKRWHVRTKDNIARVRRDEAEALKKELEQKQKLEIAEKEARIHFLRSQSGVSTSSASTHSKESKEVTKQNHVDLFADFESHIKSTNKDLEKEKKEEQEKYEKQIGYLTYLGQDTNEALKLRSWYEIAPKRKETEDSTEIEKDVKNKYLQDPLTLITSLLPHDKKSKNDVKTKKPHPAKDGGKIESLPKPHKEKKEKKRKREKRRKEKKGESSHKKKHDRERRAEIKMQETLQKKQKLEKLRKDRLQREARERARQEALLAPKEPQIQPPDERAAPATPKIVQKYNSQFNPEFAKQNMV